jgi:hypothetical protein
VLTARNSGGPEPAKTNPATTPDEDTDVDEPPQPQEPRLGNPPFRPGFAPGGPPRTPQQIQEMQQRQQQAQPPNNPPN